MTILTLDWSKEAPEKFRPGMAVRTRSGRVVVVGDDTAPMRLMMLRRVLVEWAWLVKPHELDWIGSIRKQHVKGRPEQ